MWEYLIFFMQSLEVGSMPNFEKLELGSGSKKLGSFQLYLGPPIKRGIHNSSIMRDLYLNFSNDYLGY